MSLYFSWQCLLPKAPEPFLYQMFIYLFIFSRLSWCGRRCKMGLQYFSALCFQYWREKMCFRFTALCYFFLSCYYSSAFPQNSLWSSVVRCIALILIYFLFSNNTGDNGVIGETSQNDSTQTIHDSSRAQALQSQNSPGAMVSMKFSAVVSSCGAQLATWCFSLPGTDHLKHRRRKGCFVDLLGLLLLSVSLVLKVWVCRAEAVIHNSALLRRGLSAL